MAANFKIFPRIKWQYFMQNFQILCRISKHVNSAKHGIAIDGNTVTGQYGSSTVLQQVNVQSDQQCKWTDSWGVWSQNWAGVSELMGCKISLVANLPTNPCIYSVLLLTGWLHNSAHSPLRRKLATNNMVRHNTCWHNCTVERKLVVDLFSIVINTTPHKLDRSTSSYS